MSSTQPLLGDRARGKTLARATGIGDAVRPTLDARKLGEATADGGELDLQ